MKPIDDYSYRCGAIDCFNEMIQAGVKKIALSHPSASTAERDQYLPFCAQICAQYGTSFYPEDELLATDLFPARFGGIPVILFYADSADLELYLALKIKRASRIAAGCHDAESRREIAAEFGRLLGYPERVIERHIAENLRSDRP